LSSISALIDGQTEIMIG